MMGRGAGSVGGRGRGSRRREYSPRPPDEKGGAPPSRHLWVGNLSPHVTHNVLSEHFLRFGDLDTISFHSGRSYAFISFRKEEDAVMALRALQGAPVAGSPLKIEFQKADKSFSPDRDSALLRNERHSIERRDPSIQRKDPPLHSMHENYDEDRNAEPSEVLWIGFPASLHVDEMILGRAFAPYGDIEKITTFPGRTYAFVRYRSVVAACRAKEALQGKLFNNPRVSIYFARSDISPDHGRHQTNTSSRLNMKNDLPPLVGGRFGENIRHDRDFDGPNEELRRPRFFSDMERHPRDAGISGIGRNELSGMDSPSGSNSGARLERFRFHRQGHERKVSEDPHDNFRHGPFERGVSHRDFTVERPQRGPNFEDSWNVENPDIPSAKKLRLDTFPDRELPEYPFSDLQNEAESSALNKYPGLPQQHPKRSHLDSMHLGYKGYSDNPRNILHPRESNDFWRASDTYDAGSGSLPSDSKVQRPPLEVRQPLKDEWKWEGTIAKGGTAICRARCFPVGKVLDMMLPEFLDCTARTGLDMLAKHFYQAASSWVVFFVPETDADISFYNEFMNYLGEKQRAAVAKLGEKTSLFLVPPSEFSEQVLKVPGKMSISGVVLRFQQGNDNIGALRCPVDASVSNVPSFYSQTTNMTNFDDSLRPKHSDFTIHEESYFKPSSGNKIPPTGFSNINKHDGNTSFSSHFPPVEKKSSFAGDGRYDQSVNQNPNLPPNWMPSDACVSGSDFGNISLTASNVSSRLVDNRMRLDYSAPKINFGGGSSQYMPVKQDTTLPVAHKIPLSQESNAQANSSTPLPILQPEQLAQLAALLEHQKQLSKDSAILPDGGHKQSILSEKIGVQAHNPAMDSSVSQISTAHQSQQLPNMQATNQAIPPENHGTQQIRSNNREDAETDPQKRLQATLQLAAALLQQIQQQSKTD